MGSSPNAGATASVSHPAKQGFVQSLGVYFDTMIVCSVTAFIILLSNPTLSSPAASAPKTGNNDPQNPTSATLSYPDQPAQSDTSAPSA